MKTKYRLWDTPPERAATARLLVGCPGQLLPNDATGAVPAPDPGAEPAPAPEPADPPATTDPVEVSYRSCAAVRAAGKAPLYRGDPGYSSRLDRDGDGIACDTETGSGGGSAGGGDDGSDDSGGSDDGGSVSYANCAAVRAAGKAPLHSRDPGYSRKLDRDGDGVACE